MNFSVTAAYAIPLAAILAILTINVIRTRAALKVSIGDGGDTVLHERIRRHGNFIEWVPVTLVFMMLAEAQGVSNLWLHAAGALLLAARIIHPLGLRADQPTNPLRAAGATGSLVAVVLLAGTLAAKMMA